MGFNKCRMTRERAAAERAENDRREREALAAEVTPERLINADRKPRNWLMNHRTYDSQRYSPLDKSTKPT